MKPARHSRRSRHIRRFEFEGSDIQYVLHLEERVSHLAHAYNVLQQQYTGLQEYIASLEQDKQSFEKYKQPPEQYKQPQQSSAPEGFDTSRALATPPTYTKNEKPILLRGTSEPLEPPVVAVVPKDVPKRKRKVASYVDQAEVSSFTGEEEDPERKARRKASQPPVSSGVDLLPENPKWRGIAADLLARIPKTDIEWSEARVKESLHTPKQIIDAFHILTLRSNATSMNLSSTTDKRSPQAVLHAYEQLQSTLGQHAAMSKRLHRYSVLLLFCICCVALEDGMSIKKVDELARTCLQNRTPGPKYSSRLRTCAKFLSGVIEELELDIPNFSHIFLLYGQPMETYRTLSTERKPHLVQAVREAMKVGSSESNQLDVSFSPVFLAAYVGPWSLEQVNKALKTNLSQADYDKRVRSIKALEELVYGSPASQSSPLCINPKAIGIHPMSEGFPCKKESPSPWEDHPEDMSSKAESPDWGRYTQDTDCMIEM